MDDLTFELGLDRERKEECVVISLLTSRGFHSGEHIMGESQRV